MRLRAPTAANSRGGYVIFAVLIVVVVLSLVAYRFADAMAAEHRAAQRSSDEVQVRLAAVSGLHYAAAVLADRDTFYGELDGNPYDNADIFEQFEVPVTGSLNTPRRAYFSIRAAARNDDGNYEQRFGVIDEGGKLNLNSLLALDIAAKAKGELIFNALMKLPNMTEEIADAIVDWLDADDDARVSGAESSYYLSLPNPYKAKNGPLNSLDEMLLIKGVTPELLYGGDTNRNGILDEGETDATRGWSDFITVYGRELNVDMKGNTRIFINSDSLTTIYDQLVQAVDTDLATYIIASKLLNPAQIAPPVTAVINDGTNSTIAISFAQPNQPNERPATTDELYALIKPQMDAAITSGKKILSLMDLTNTKITLPRDPMAPPNSPNVVAYSPLAENAPTADPAKRKELLAKLLDRVTSQQPIELVPRINVNTAPREVLLSVTDKNGDSILTETEIDALLTQRAIQVTDLATDPGTVSAAWLITTNTVSVAKFKAMEKYITGSTMVYRVQSIGYVGEGGPVARMEAVIDIGVRDAETGAGSPRFLFVRDLSDIDNPRGFQPNPPK